MKKTLYDINVKGKVVFVRDDLNVPMSGGTITSSLRIKAALPTLLKLMKDGGRVVVLSHLGKVKTKEDKATKSLAPIAVELEKLIGTQVKFVPFTRGPEVEEAIDEMNNSDVIVLENTRFEDLDGNKESSNDEELAKYWAGLADVFVNDAFGTSHRSHASNVGIATYVQESAIGFLVEKEVTLLSKAMFEPDRPLVTILGGAKISDKIRVIEKYIEIADKIIICGGMSYTFLKAQGIGIGESIVEDDKVELARSYLKNHLDKFVLPIDIVYTSTYKNEFRRSNTVNPLEIPDGFIGMDLGDKSIELYKKELEGARTVIWNGPAGVTEFANFEKGTKELAKTIVELDGAYTILGGGDSIAAAESLGLADKFSHVSTGGGASLQFLSGGEMPGIISIQEFVPPLVDEKIIGGKTDTPKGHVEDEIFDEDESSPENLDEMSTDEFRTVEVNENNVIKTEEVDFDEAEHFNTQTIASESELEFSKNKTSEDKFDFSNYETLEDEFEFTEEVDFEDEFQFDEDEEEGPKK